MNTISALIWAKNCTVWQTICPKCLKKTRKDVSRQWKKSSWPNFKYIENMRNNDDFLFSFKTGKKAASKSIMLKTRHCQESYFEALDTILNLIKDRFNQPGCQIFSNIEQLLLNSINKEIYISERETLPPSCKHLIMSCAFYCSLHSK